MESDITSISVRSMFVSVSMLTLFFCFSCYFITIISFPLTKHIITSRYFATLAAIQLFFIFGSCVYIAPSVFLRGATYYITTDNLLQAVTSLDCALSLSLTPLSLSFALLILIIGVATNLYTLNYFKNEADELGFLFWLNSFILSMLFLVLAANFFMLFLGWELIGLTSFFLINFWQAKRSTLKSSFKAFSFNLVSDLFLLLALISLYYGTNSSDCDVVLFTVAWAHTTPLVLIQVGAGALVLCAAIKSVQIIGHLWLPDSMEAPVPASSLIHSATLVSAGIYLLCKFQPLYALLHWQNTLLLLGALTAAYGGVVAAAQTDMKKLLAYSTMSHSGFLWILAVSGHFFITILYLFLHGLFKASTFYCAGSFIRIFGSQDTRWMGFGATYARGDAYLLLFCSMNLAGLPFTMGAIYKQFFFKVLLLSANNWLTVGLCLVGLLTSLIYFFRLNYYVLFDFLKTVKNTPMEQYQKVKVKLDPLAYVQPNHILAVSLLLAFAFVTVYVFYWVLHLNVLQFGVGQLPGFFLLKLQLETLYATYYIYFYAAYLFTFVLLLLLTNRTNYALRETLIASFYLFVIVMCF